MILTQKQLNAEFRIAERLHSPVFNMLSERSFNTFMQWTETLCHEETRQMSRLVKDWR